MGFILELMKKSRAVALVRSSGMFTFIGAVGLIFSACPSLGQEQRPANPQQNQTTDSIRVNVPIVTFDVGVLRDQPLRRPLLHHRPIGNRGGA
jgi:hypothetical protein